MHHPDAVASAEAILSTCWRGVVRLGEAEPLGSSDRSQVGRHPVLEGPAGAPASVIMKSVPEEPDTPYDPENGERFGVTWRFFNDWAGAEFLSQVAGGDAVGPRFLGGDRALGFILLEDLGPGQSAAELLLGSDPAGARAALVNLGIALGRMHSASAGRAAEYRTLRERLGLVSDAGSSPDRETAEALEKMTEGCRKVGVSIPASVEEEAERAARLLAEPGDFACYTHGDPCPDNNRVLGAEVRLIDFEFGGIRHALIDGSYGRVPFPTCWCVNRLPTEVTREMETAYRTELARGIPRAADDRVFHEAAAAACARWLIWTTGGSLGKALAEDHPWGVSSMRQRLLYRFDLFAATAAELQNFEALGELTARLAASLRERWGPEAEMPLYPAFAPAPASGTAGGS